MSQQMQVSNTALRSTGIEEFPSVTSASSIISEGGIFSDCGSATMPSQELLHSKLYKSLKVKSLSISLGSTEPNLVLFIVPALLSIVCNAVVANVDGLFTGHLN